MSFSKLPEELKEKVLLAVHAQDRVIRKLRKVEGRKLAPRRAWNGWFGRGTLAMSSVNKELRRMALPLLFEPLDISKLVYDDLEACIYSDVGSSCRSVIIGMPGVAKSKRFLDLARERNFSRNHKYQALLRVFEVIASMERLNGISFAPVDGDDDELEKMFKSFVRPDLHVGYYSNESSPEPGYLYFDPPTPPGAAPETPPELVNGGGFHALNDIAARITSWSFPFMMRANLVCAFLAAAPSVVEHVALENSAKYNYDCRYDVLSRPAADIVSALCACTSLKSLRLGVAKPSTPMVHPAWFALPPSLSSLTSLQLTLDDLDHSVLEFISSFPCLANLAVEVSFRFQNLRPLQRTTVPLLSSFSLAAPSLAHANAVLPFLSLPALDSLTLNVYWEDGFAWSPSDKLESERAVFVNSVPSAAPALRRLHLTAESTLWPRDLVEQIREGISRLPSPVALFADEVDEPDAGAEVEMEVEEMPLSPADRARELARWVLDAVDQAEQAGDEGATRLLVDSMGTVVQLQRLLAE
ncbi:hypothetical protein JCM10213_005121 [Rhodosporidiobolus nylandii]